MAEKKKFEWPKEPPKDTEFCLVGIGKHSLADLMANVKTPEGKETLLHAFDRSHWPPRYRPTRICTEEEKQTFIDYMLWLNEQFTGENKCQES